MEKLKVEELDKVVRKQTVGGKIAGGLYAHRYALIVGLIVICLILVCTFTVVFKANVSWKTLTLQTILYTSLMYAAYWIMIDYGKERGILSESYLSALKHYSEAHDKIKGKMYNDRLNDFCRYKQSKIVEERKHDIILDSTVSYDEYVEKYSKMSVSELTNAGLEKDDIKAITAANKAKPPHLKGSDLWERESFDKIAELISRSGKKTTRIRKALKLVFLLVTSGLVASVSIKGSFTFDFVVIIALFFLAVNFVTAFSAGYNAYAKTEALRYETRAELLDEAFEYCERNN